MAASRSTPPQRLAAVSKDTPPVLPPILPGGLAAASPVRRKATVPQATCTALAMALKKMVSITASAVCSINLLDRSAPLCDLGRLQGQGSFNSLSMTAVFAVIVILAVSVFALGYLLTVINNKYDELSPAAGRRPPNRHARGCGACAMSATTRSAEDAGSVGSRGWCACAVARRAGFRGPGSSSSRIVAAQRLACVGNCS